jgi:hypothetical protein
MPMRSNMPEQHRATKPRSLTNRSRITNGKDILAGVDQRSAAARRFRDVLINIYGDLGGLDLLSEGQRQLARRCATIAVACEKMEACAVAGQDIDLEVYGTLTDRLGRAFSRLGLKRVAKDITPSVADYVKHLNEQEEADA